MQLKDAKDVSIAVGIVKKAGCKFVIRNTGNNSNPGFSSTDQNGIVLDVRSLSGFSLDDDGCMQAGVGAKWDDIQPFLESRQLSAIGPRHGGDLARLGGFLLGGVWPLPFNLCCM